MHGHWKAVTDRDYRARSARVQSDGEDNFIGTDNDASANDGANDGSDDGDNGASGGGATPTAKPVSAYSESALSAQCNLDIKSQVTAGMGHLGAAFETAIVP